MDIHAPEPVKKNRSAVIAAWIMISASLIIGFLTRFTSLVHYVDFNSDQAYDAHIIARMWGISPIAMGRGDHSYSDVVNRTLYGPIPALGSPIPGNVFYLGPLYYCLVFPLTVLGHHPALQAVPNALFSFLTIPLVAFGIYRLLEGQSDALRVFWAAVSGLWWSVMLNEIVRGTRDWNPSSVPFFLLSFVLLASAQIRRPSFGTKAVAAWVVIGMILDILCSLHATMIYLMPIVFTICAGFFIVRANRKVHAAALVTVSLASGVVFLTPYWYGEMHTHWSNSHAMVEYTANQITIKTTLQEKAANALRPYAWLSGQFYFLGGNKFIRCIGLVFLITAVALAYRTFRGDRVLLMVLSCVWLVFLCEAALHPAAEERYRLSLVMAPLFLAVSAVTSLDYDLLWARVAGILLTAGIVLSGMSNIAMDVRHNEFLFGPMRLVSVSDTIDAFMHIPRGASVCDWHSIDDYRSDRYIDGYVTHRDLHFAPCAPGMYQIVPKHIAWAGTDLFSKEPESFLAYLEYFGPYPGPPLPAGAASIEENEALTLVLRAPR